MKVIATNEAPQAIGPYSQAVEVNGFIFTSGQIALTPAGEIEVHDIEGQTHQVLTNLQQVLLAANATLNSVVKTTIFLANMDDFEKVNAIYATYFGEHKPARSTVAVKTLPKNVLVEIECIAIADGDYSF
jgi:2-iminobutanoate/2-iminopropanoate deaminase